MSKKIKFEHALNQWTQTEKLRHQKKSQKSSAKKITHSIKKIRKIVSNFIYLHCLPYKHTSKNKASISQPHIPGQHVKTSPENNQKVLAVIIHAFYFDIFTHILEKTRSIGVPYTLYITTHKEIAQKVSSHLKLLGLDAHIKVYENRGRDILPFLRILDLIKANGHHVILKLHTKKSPHILSGRNDWCDGMVDQLLEATIVDKAIENFITHPTIGLIGPHKHLYPLWRKKGSNMVLVKELADKIGCQSDINNQSFVGGTMFYAKANVFDSLLKLNLKTTDFAEEPISVDGTLAHAIERVFGIAASENKLNIVDTKFIKSLSDQDAN